MKTPTTIRYLMLRIYSNEELSAYLTEKMEQNWVLEKTRGNFLTFRRQTIKNAKLCIATAICSKLNPKEDEAIQEYLTIAKRVGWELLCIGDFEGVLPAKRRLYFYTTKNLPEPFEADDTIAFQNAYRAQRSTLTWMLLWLFLACAAWLTTIPFMMQIGFHPVIVLLDISALIAAACVIRLRLNRKRFFDRITKGTPKESGDLRTIELSVLVTWTVVVICTVLFLLS